jgi:hypothetical protein
VSAVRARVAAWLAGVGRGTWIGLGAVAALVGAVWAVKTLVVPRPYWALSFGDGEMVFFFNSLLVAEGRRPAEVFHPATPILLAGGLVARLWPHPLDTIQGFLLFWNAVGLLAALLGMALFAVTMLRGRTAAVVAATLLVYWLHPSALTYLTIWSSYQLHLPLVVAMLLALRWLLRRLDRMAPQDVLAVGAVGGVACSVQLILLAPLVGALVALPVAVLSGVPLGERPSPWSRPLARGAGALALLLTGLSLAMILRYRPVLPGMRLFGALLVAAAAGYVGLAWSGRVVAASRIASVMRIEVTLAAGALLGFLATSVLVIDRLYLRYAYGYVYNIPLGAPDMSVLQNVAALLRRAVLWTLRSGTAAGPYPALALVVVLALLRTLWRLGRHAGDAAAAIDVAEGLALLVALALSVIPALVSGLPEAPNAVSFRYLIPAAAVVMVAVAWVSEQARRVAAPATLAPAKWLGVAFVLVACAFQTVGDLRAHLDARAAGLAQSRGVTRTIDEARQRLGREPVVVLYEVARPAWALRWGSFHADQRFDAILDRRFPTEREVSLFAVSARPDDWDVVPRDGRRADLVILRGDTDPDLLEALAALGTVRAVGNGPARSRIVVITPRNAVASAENPARMGRPAAAGGAR